MQSATPDPSPSDEPLVLAAPIAHRLSITPQTLRTWSQTGRFPPPFRVGQRFAWRRADAEAAIASILQPVEASHAG